MKINKAISIWQASVNFPKLRRWQTNKHLAKCSFFGYKNSSIALCHAVQWKFQRCQNLTTAMTKFGRSASRSLSVCVSTFATCGNSYSSHHRRKTISTKTNKRTFLARLIDDSKSRGTVALWFFFFLRQKFKTETVFAGFFFPDFNQKVLNIGYRNKHIHAVSVENTQVISSKSLNVWTHLRAKSEFYIDVKYCFVAAIRIGVGRRGKTSVTAVADNFSSTYDRYLNHTHAHTESNLSLNK